MRYCAEAEGSCTFDLLRDALERRLVVRGTSASLPFDTGVPVRALRRRRELSGPHAGNWRTW